MRVVYSFFMVLATPLVLAYFLMRARSSSAWLRRWNERFGLFPANIKPGSLLLHAVSVGEFNAARPLVKALLKAYPQLQITISTFTPTGSERVRQVLGDKVYHCYMPLDLPFVTQRFLNRLQPQMIIVMESEIWPNFYHQAHRLGIPLLIANARMSDRSFYRFRFVSGLIRRSLQTVYWLGSQSKEDGRRFLFRGANPARIETTGNLKYDLELPPRTREKIRESQIHWSCGRPVVVAGSTHRADENVIFPAFKQLLNTLPTAVLVLAPRHPERFDSVIRRASAMGFDVETFSQTEHVSAHTQCFVLDAMGKLMKYYGFADIAFVGGSLGDTGGHNALEPAALGKPVLFGPNMDNAREIASQLLECGSALRIKDVHTLHTTLITLLNDEQIRNRMGRAGLGLIEKNKGAITLTLAAIQQRLRP